MLSFSLLFFPLSLSPSSCSVSSQWGTAALCRQRSTTAEASASCCCLLFGCLHNYAVTCAITYNVPIRDRFHCVLFKSAEVVEALQTPLQIAELCLWFLTLPDDCVTNGPTCEAFCVKVTIAVTLALHAHVVDCPDVFVPACCSVAEFLCCVGLYWAYLCCTALISLCSSSALSCLGSSHQHRWYIPAPLLPTSLTVIHWLFVLPIHLGQHRGRKDTWRHMAVLERGLH